MKHGMDMSWQRTAVQRSVPFDKRWAGMGSWDSGEMYSCLAAEERWMKERRNEGTKEEKHS